MSTFPCPPITDVQRLSLPWNHWSNNLLECQKRDLIQQMQSLVARSRYADQVDAIIRRARGRGVDPTKVAQAQAKLDELRVAIGDADRWIRAAVRDAFNGGELTEDQYRSTNPQPQLEDSVSITTTVVTITAIVGALILGFAGAGLVAALLLVVAILAQLTDLIARLGGVSTGVGRVLTSGFGLVALALVLGGGVYAWEQFKRFKRAA